MNSLSSLTTLAADINRPTLRLNQCPKNTCARIVELLPQPALGIQDERVTLRLKELGFLPGAAVKVIGFGLLGHDPIAVQVNGTKFALRHAEAAKILIQVEDAAE
jgi:ferrous iron transport protein A